MRVLVAAAGESGAVAAETLEAAGFSVERVATLADARVRAATVPVAVVGDLRDAAPAELRARLREVDVDTPLVGLDRGDEFVAAVDGPADERLPGAVRLAPHAAAYRDATADLYEQCRRRADGGDGDVTAARRAATDDLDRARRLAGRTPYEYLLED